MATAGFVSVVFIVIAPACRHWFAIPVFACGVILAFDVLPWVRGKWDLFDVRGIVGACGFHHFFIAPQLHAGLDVWARYVIPPDDWRNALGIAATINVPSLILYRAAARHVERRGGVAKSRRLLSNQAGIVMAGAVSVASVALLWLLSRMGGIAGLVQAYEQRVEDPSPFAGMGWLFAIAESLPLLLLAWTVLLIEKRGAWRRWQAAVLLLAVFLFARILVGGLRGSRGNVVFALFWALAVIHSRVWRIPRIAVPIGAVALVGFLYGYGVYKYLGMSGVRAVQTDGSFRGPDDNLPSISEVLLEDLARADIQALLASRFWDARGEIPLAGGRTYLGSAALLVPRSLLADRPYTKIEEGTLLLFGRRASEAAAQASNLYGLAGEAMLNFGLVGIPICYCLFGLVVGRIKVWQEKWKPPDVRSIVVPILVVVAVQMLLADSDVVVAQLVTLGAPVTTALLCASRSVTENRSPRRERTA